MRNVNPSSGELLGFLGRCGDWPLQPNGGGRVQAYSRGVAEGIMVHRASTEGTGRGGWRQATWRWAGLPARVAAIPARKKPQLPMKIPFFYRPSAFRNHPWGGMPALASQSGPFHSSSPMPPCPFLFLPCPGIFPSRGGVCHGNYLVGPFGVGKVVSLFSAAE